MTYFHNTYQIINQILERNIKLTSCIITLSFINLKKVITLLFLKSSL